MPSGLTITSTDFTSFVTNTVIDPSEVNNNFSTYRGHLLPVDLTASSAVNQSFYIGSPEYRYRGVHAAPILGLTTVSGAYTAGQNDNVILCSNASTAAYTITLPSAASITGKGFSFKRTDNTASSITIDGNSSETIDGTLTVSLSGGRDSIELISDGTNWVIKNKGVFNSMVRLHTGNGHGSTNTFIRRFTTAVDNFGSAITYADSAADGAAFTINEDGVYSINYVDSRSGGTGRHGVSLNSSEVTTTVQSITTADRLAFAQHGSAGDYAPASWTGFLNSGDIIRAHDNGASDATTLSVFTIVKVGG